MVDASLEVWDVRIYLCVVLQSLRTCVSIMCVSECVLVSVCGVTEGEWVWQ